MPIFRRGEVSIYYEDSEEDLPAVLLLAPGGMKSSLRFWEGTPWDPRVLLKEKFRVVAMDQRNAGHSKAPISSQDGWHSFATDQIGLMDYLDIKQFHVIGMCIGGPYAFGLIERVSDRVLSATLFQTIGLDNNRNVFFSLFDDWSYSLRSQMPEVESEAWSSFRENMFGGDKVLFNVDEAFVSQCEVPLLVLMGDDIYHPKSTSLMISEISPRVTFIQDWKSGEAREKAKQKCLEFLEAIHL